MKKIDWSNTADLIAGILTIIMILSGISFLTLSGVRYYQKKQLTNTPLEQRVYHSYMEKSKQQSANFNRASDAINYIDTIRDKRLADLRDKYDKLDNAKNKEQMWAEIERETKIIKAYNEAKWKEYNDLLNYYLAEGEKLRKRYASVIYRNESLDKAIDTTGILSGFLFLMVFFWMLGRDSFSSIS